MARRTCLLVGNYTFSLVNFRGDLIRELQGLGFDVIGCGPQRDVNTERVLAQREVRFVQIPMERVGANPLADLRSLLFLYRLCRREKPDLVLSYTIKPVIYASLAARTAGCPRIFSMLTGLGTPFLSNAMSVRIMRGLIRNLYRLALRYNEKVFFQNGDDEKYFLDARLVTKRQVERTNGSGVNVEYFAARPVPDGAARFLMMARLLSDKGVREFAEAARRVKKDQPSAEFHLAGMVEDHPKGIAPEEVAGWERAGVLKYWGRVDDVRPLLEACSVYVLPSYREGTPRSVLEAMATGRAIITTDAPGCRETVQPGRNGLLVPIKDAPALAEAMAHMIGDPAGVRRMGRESRAIAVELYDVRKVNARLLRSMGLVSDAKGDVAAGSARPAERADNAAVSEETTP